MKIENFFNGKRIEIIKKKLNTKNSPILCPGHVGGDSVVDVGHVGVVDVDVDIDHN